MQLGISLSTSGKALAAPAIGLPFFGFAALCIMIFVSSRKRPGETPIGLLSEHLSDVLRRMRPPKRWFRQVRA